MARRKRRPKAQMGWNYDDDAIQLTHTTEFADANFLLSFDDLVESTTVDQSQSDWFVKRIILRGFLRLLSRTDDGTTRPRRRCQVGLCIGDTETITQWAATPTVGGVNMWSQTSAWNDNIRRVLRQDVYSAYDVWQPTIESASNGDLTTTSNPAASNKAQLFDCGPPHFEWDLRLAEGLRDGESLALGLAVEGLDLDWESGDSVELEYLTKILLQKRRGA